MSDSSRSREQSPGKVPYVYDDAGNPLRPMNDLEKLMRSMEAEFGWGDHEQQEPITVDIPGIGTLKGWNKPGFDVTPFEFKHGIDLVGPEGGIYNVLDERIITDWDDTMKDTGKWWIQAHREVLQDFGFDEEETSDANILKLFGNIHVGDTLGIERFIKDGVQYSDDEVWGLIKSRAGELLANSPMDPLLVDALKAARLSGVRLAVWSSSPRELIEQAVHANGLDGVFDTIVSVDDVEKHKPDPEGVYKAVKAMDIARGYIEDGEEYGKRRALDMNGVWMLGDSSNDVKGGKDAGAHTLWLEHPLQAHAIANKRRAVMEQAATRGEQAVREASDMLLPTIVSRNFDMDDVPAENGRQIATNQPFESIADRTSHNLELIRFLIDRDYRKAAVRGEKLIRNLHRQLGDSLIKRSVLLEDGGVDLSVTDKPRLTREELEREVRGTIDLYVPIRQRQVANGYDEDGDNARLLAALGYAS